MKNRTRLSTPASNVAVTLTLIVALLFIAAIPTSALTKRARRAPSPGRERASATATTTTTAPKLTMRQRIERAVAREAARHRIDPLLIWALLNQESGWSVQATSYKGAQGPMQLMPATARRWGVRNPRDPDEAVRGGTEYLVWLIDRFGGDVALGLAGYNSGEGAVDKYGRRIPPYRETQEYVKRIAAGYERLRRSGAQVAATETASLDVREGVGREVVAEKKDEKGEAESVATEARPLTRPPVKLRVAPNQ